MSQLRPSASFSATLRVHLDDRPGAFADLAHAIGDAGGNLGAIDLVRVESGKKVRDVTVDAASADHIESIGAADAWPICLATKDVDEIVAAVTAIAPGFGGINLEDISAPRCFEIESRLKETVDIPVFHDDQHGTAVVVIAAFLNALHLVGKQEDQIRVVMTGVGAAGIATTDMLPAAVLRYIIGCDPKGEPHRTPDDLGPWTPAF